MCVVSVGPWNSGHEIVSPECFHISKYIICISVEPSIVDLLSFLKMITYIEVPLYILPIAYLIMIGSVCSTMEPSCITFTFFLVPSWG